MNSGKQDASKKPYNSSLAQIPEGQKTATYKKCAGYCKTLEVVCERHSEQSAAPAEHNECRIRAERQLDDKQRRECKSRELAIVAWYDMRTSPVNSEGSSNAPIAAMLL